MGLTVYCRAKKGRVWFEPPQGRKGFPRMGPVNVAARATGRGRATMASAAGRHGTQGTQPPRRAACRLRVSFQGQLKLFGARGAFDVSASAFLSLI